MMITDQPVEQQEEAAAAPYASEQEIAISVRNVSKMYRIYDRPQDRLKRMFLRGRGGYGREFWALHDVSLDVYKGETVGIIGRNGSGKSTLLQIIAGTLAHTYGQVHVNGRVAALLELGSGFNPEFSGRDNVFLNGAILGLSYEEMERRFDDIATFADIGEFIEQPVKLYSSGMYARLAFAIGIYLDPDIFIIDEALSVGDVFFQARCARKLAEYRESGGTVLFVTHDTYTLERICTRSIVLYQGRKYFEGPNADAVNTYYQLERNDAAGQLVEQMDQPPGTLTGQVELRRDHITGDGSAFIEEVSIVDNAGNSTTTFQVGEWMTVHLQVRFERDLEQFDFGIGVRDRTGVLLGGAHTFYQHATRGPARSGQRIHLTGRVHLAIAPGPYLLLIGIARNFSPEYWEDYYVLWDCCAINVIGDQPFWGQFAMASELR